MDSIANAPKERKMAFACSYVPEEIILAAGFTPTPIHPDKPPSDGEPHIYPNTCGYLKSLLAQGLYHEMAGAEGIVFANCCDGMRKLHDIWERCVPGTPSLFLEVPKKKDRLSVEFFASELKCLAAGIQDRFHAPWEIGQDELERAIRACNKTRKKMTAQLAQIAENGGAMKASRVFALCYDTTNTSRQALPAQTDHGQTQQNESPTHNGSVRVVLVGSRLRNPGVTSLIEDSGARVVALDACMTTRRFEGFVEEGSENPYLALAERTLSRPPCPRMDLFEDRMEYLLSLVKETSAAGVVFVPLKFCDPFQYDVLLLGQRLKQEDIPLLIVESGYEPSVPEQIRTRIQAFVETLGRIGRQKQGVEP